jgi:hypothetical protein
METTRNELPIKLNRFLKKLGNYLDTPLYYYGSIQRKDYVAGQSDIDVAIFSDNENSVIAKMCNYLRVKRKDFKSFIKKTTTSIVYGYKIKYITNTNESNPFESNPIESNPIECELSVFNITFKPVLMDHYNKTINAPIFILFLLYILKQIYYVFPIISKDTYRQIKYYIFDVLYLKIEGESFFILEPPNQL